MVEFDNILKSLGKVLLKSLSESLEEKDTLVKPNQNLSVQNLNFKDVAETLAFFEKQGGKIVGENNIYRLENWAQVHSVHNSVSKENSFVNYESKNHLKQEKTENKSKINSITKDLSNTSLVKGDCKVNYESKNHIKKEKTGDKIKNTEVGNDLSHTSSVKGDCKVNHQSKNHHKKEKTGDKIKNTEVGNNLNHTSLVKGDCKVNHQSKNHHKEEKTGDKINNLEANQYKRNEDCKNVQRGYNNVNYVETAISKNNTIKDYSTGKNRLILDKVIQDRIRIVSSQNNKFHHKTHGKRNYSIEVDGKLFVEKEISFLDADNKLIKTRMLVEVNGNEKNDWLKMIKQDEQSIKEAKIETPIKC